MNLIKALRPLHWLKNLLVLAPVFFSGGLFDRELMLRELVAFAGFCAIASHIYIVNDLHDAGRDRHDVARGRRPYASGAVGPGAMLALGGAAAVLAAAIAFYLGPSFQFIVLAYTVLMYSYTFLLKRYVFVGAAIISLGMMLRVFAGAVAIDAPVSPWVYPVAFFLSLYVVLGKKIYYLGGDAPAGRTLKYLFMISGALTGIGYLAYCFSGVGQEKYGTEYMWVTAPFVLAAIYRYSSIAARPPAGREHLEAVLSDVLLTALAIIWAVVFGFIIY